MSRSLRSSALRLRRRQQPLPLLPLLAVAALIGPTSGDVSCGNHNAATCAACSQGHGADWCNGACTWDYQQDKCVPLGQREEMEGEDLYELLEVTDDADLADIKKNYRKLSVVHHPDKNPADPKRFNLIRDAYEVLSNPDRRVLYDTGGMQAVKDAEQGKAETGEGREKTLEVSLAELYVGVRRKIHLSRRVICRKCRRTKDPVRCKGCTACPPGKKIIHVRNGPFLMQQHQEVPSTEDCKTETTDLDVTVDPGSSAGDRIVFKHMGSQKPGMIPGDVTVSLVQRSKKDTAGLGWQRQGQDLRIRMNLTLREALLGFTRTIRHLDMHTVEFSTTSVTRPLQVMRIKNEGMPLKDVPSQAGDLYVTLGVDFPQALTGAEREELEGVRALQAPAAAGSRDEL